MCHVPEFQTEEFVECGDDEKREPNRRCCALPDEVACGCCPCCVVCLYSCVARICARRFPLPTVAVYSVKRTVGGQTLRCRPPPPVANNTRPPMHDS